MSGYSFIHKGGNNCNATHTHTQDLTAGPPAILSNKIKTREDMNYGVCSTNISKAADRYWVCSDSVCVYICVCNPV